MPPGSLASYYTRVHRLSIPISDPPCSFRRCRLSRWSHTQAAVQGCTYIHSFDRLFDRLRSSAARSPLCVPATRHLPYAHRRNNGRRETPVCLSVVSVYELGKKPKHLPSFASWYSSPGIFQLQLRFAAHISTFQHFRQQHVSTTCSSAIAAFGDAAVAINAQQSIAFDLSTQLPSACATNTAHGVGASPDAGVSNVDEIDINAPQDVDRSRSKSHVPVRRGQPNGEAD